MDLEQKFPDHFFSSDYELDLVDLVALAGMTIFGGFGIQETDVFKFT
jgi:hypothetical protein